MEFKISVNDKEIFSLSETQQKVIMNDIHEDELYEDLCRRIRYILTHKYEQCFKRLKDEWEIKVGTRHSLIPSDPEAFAELIMSQPDYKSRKNKEE